MMHLLVLFLSVFLSLSSAQSVKGYYRWTWSSKGVPSGTNLGIAFNGWADPNRAVSDSATTKNILPSPKYISVGGGNANGRWTPDLVKSVTTAIGNNAFSGYTGVCYDIEEGDSGLAQLFEDSFAKAKSKGLKVLVTISHSGPYAMPDASTVMTKIFASSNVDYVSPQLYTYGTETVNDYTTSGGVAWSSWKTSKAPILLSIASSSLWNCANTYFTTTLGFPASKIPGYLLWNNDNPVGSASCGGGSGPSPRTTRCGKDWADANGKCGKQCVTNNECIGSADGTLCYGQLSAISGCNAAAVEETSATTLNDLGMSPTVIGLSIVIAVIGLALIIVSVLLYKKSNVVRVEEMA